ncbi:unnamed protein product [Musa acuminata subsp. malaccensis]|uniref:(wild Malaysian banana) hypothetical protein n=1 Tax=Musa acuminata subsp. malaccensis TaxID=214687 RepID=A0A804JI14_MUSAM|nr:unnamed protein product [Musa acuminata subsp. malaccensis]
MSELKRDSVVAARLLLILLLLVSCCHGSRDIEVYKERYGGMRNPGYFMGFLPRGVPIPPSGPSRQHNSIGLQRKAPP